MYKEFLEIVGNGSPTGSVLEETICSFRHDMNKRGKSSPSNPSQTSFMQQSERKPSRTRSPRGKSPSGRMSRWPCKDYLRGTCNNSFSEKWHLPECLFYKTKSGCRFGERCSFAHRQVDEQQLGCVFQDMTPPKSILWKCTDMQRPIQRVKIHKGYCASH